MLPSTPALHPTLDRVVSTAVNGFEVARYGGLRTEEAPAPYDVAAHGPVFRLRHYYPDEPSGRAPVLLIPPLMQVAEVWDLSPSTSAVSQLRDLGVDPWVIDFGDPAVEPGGPERTFGDHVLAVVEAIGRIKEHTGRDVHVLGYSQGGIFAYVAAAYRECDAVASVITLGSPVSRLPIDDFVPEQLFWNAARLSGKVLGRTGLPRWAVASIFNWMSPHRTITSDAKFLLALHDRESLLPREPQRKFLKTGAWIAWSGPAIQEVLEIVRTNRLIEGGVVIGDRTVGLADLTCPVLTYLGEADFLAPTQMVRSIMKAAPRADVYECSLPVGHFGLPVSSHARAKTWPGVAAWTDWQSAQGDLPDYITHLTPADLDTDERPTARGAAASLSYGLGLAVEAGLGVPGTLTSTTRRVAGSVRELSREAASQLPRLVQLERMTPSTRISYASLLDDEARHRPDDAAFLFAGRASTHAEAKQRIDATVRALLAAGVRKGEHVGVLMGVGPTALGSVAALNRIGAVAVLLRPGEDTDREIELGQATRVLTDDQHAGGVDDARHRVVVLPEATYDETPPAWYQPNPGRARDLAFILFQGRGADLRADGITNGSWATSALVASSAAALTRDDTIYSASPLHHPSGLLLATGAATASGARLALASPFSPEVFWSEVRRYGATVVTYTWTMLDGLVSSPVRPEERDHPVRLFVGSGMPAGLWRRVERRFAPARVLELYASTRTDAILGNVSGRKPGALGRALPGSPRVRVVRHDHEHGGPLIGPDGYAVACAPGETGLLLVAARPGRAAQNAVPLRGVFAPDDAWISSDDLFRVDPDGDLWLVGHEAHLIATDDGAVVAPRDVEQALESLDEVGLASCYSGSDPVSGATVAAVAVTRHGARKLTAARVTHALQGLDPDARPSVVHVEDELAMTSWYRPSTSVLASAGVPAGASTWWLERGTGRYRRRVSR